MLAAGSGFRGARGRAVRGGDRDRDRGAAGVAAAGSRAAPGWVVTAAGFLSCPGGDASTYGVITDRCDGTLVRVRRGRVAVRDLRLRRTIILRAGQSYVAKLP